MKFTVLGFTFAGFVHDAGISRFWLPSIFMGLGIAIDVFLATVSKFRDPNMGFWNWVFPIMCTHIGLPALGYYGFWELRKEFPFLSPILGFTGFALVFLFVYEVVCKAIGVKPIFGISAWVSERVGFAEDDVRRAIAIMAVSWDALWSGPAKAAQAAEGAWNTIEVAISFLIAGVTVAIVAQVALGVARYLRARGFKSVKQMASWIFWGKLNELSIIGGFGILSLLREIVSNIDIYGSVFIAGAILGATWAIFRKQIWESSTEEALQAVEA